MIHSYLKKVGFILLITIALEIIVFNHRALFSMMASDQHLDVYWSGEGYIGVWGSGKANYVYMEVANINEEQSVLEPVKASVFIQDEGNRNLYELGEVTICPFLKKNNYFKIHSYGNVKAILIVLDEKVRDFVKVTDIVCDAKVPFSLSAVRMTGVFILICLGYIVRPDSKLYFRKWTSIQECSIALGVILINVLFFAILVTSNPSFQDPVWEYHSQYQELAVSLSHGKVTINEDKEDLAKELEALDNPYDTRLRRETIDGVDRVWDTCYYQGNFYVYFGIVPVLLFYLPFYLVTGNAFATWMGVFVAGSMTVGGVYYFLAMVRKRWFPTSSFLWYLVLAIIMSNGMQLCCAMLHADFYYLPILMALAFSLWGMGLIIAAVNIYEQLNEKEGTNRIVGIRVALRLSMGSLCLALTAGCRPQFLVGSILAGAVVFPFLKTTGAREIKRQKLLWVISIVIPYVVTAIGVMYYNFIRFGSAFNFGANYNLTTNDMTRRGFEAGRIPDGLFMYLFQFPNWKIQFPFVEVTTFHSDYLGDVIRDWTYGGVFWTHAVLFVLVGISFQWKKLKEKGVLVLVVLSLAMAFVVIVTDTEMAGILNRYYIDFLWLLMIPAVIVLFELWELGKSQAWLRIMVALVLTAGIMQIIYEFGIAIHGSGIISSNAYRYYILKSMLP